jgi:hypothetical protein
MTALQWYIQQLEERGHDLPYHIEERALEQEQQQIKDAYNIGYKDCECNCINDADNYVNELNQKL